MRIKSFSYWKPLRIDRYILTEALVTFLGANVFIIFIFLILQALRLTEFFVVHGASGTLLGKMAFFMSISFLPTSLPLAFLVSVLMAFGRISADSELVGMKACGLSLTRLSIPIFFFSFFVVVLSIFLNLEWVPKSEMAFKKTQIKLGNTKVVSAIKGGTFTSGFFDLLIFADKVDSRTNRLYRVFIYDEREPKSPLTYVAREAEIVPLRSRAELGAEIVLRLYEGSMHQNNIESHSYEKIDFQSYVLYLKVDEGADTTILKPHMILYGDLLTRIKEFPPNSFLGREFRGELWRRFANAFSSFVFVFLGVGFGTFRFRSARTGAILTAFAIIIVYWVLQTIGTAAVLRGDLPPFFAMQFPNFLFLFMGIIAFRRSAW